MPKKIPCHDLSKQHQLIKKQIFEAFEKVYDQNAFAGGACGKAGCLTTKHDEFAKRVRRLRNHGSSTRYDHDETGYNYRMGGLEGASLGKKLNLLVEWNHRRKAIGALYRKNISNTKITMQAIPNCTDGVNHLFVITTDNRDPLVEHMAENGITAAFHYPLPCHLLNAFRHLGYKKGDFPVSEHWADNCNSLPVFPEFSDADVTILINCTNNY